MEALTLIAKVEARTSRDGLRKSEGKRLISKQPGKINKDYILWWGLCFHLSPSWKKPISVLQTLLLLGCEKFNRGQNSIVPSTQMPQISVVSLLVLVVSFWHSRSFALYAFSIQPLHSRKSHFSSSGPIPLLVWLELPFHICKGGLNTIVIFMYVPGNAEESTFAHNRLRWCQRRRLGLLFEQGPTTSAATLRFTLHSLAR